MVLATNLLFWGIKVDYRKKMQVDALKIGSEQGLVPHKTELLTILCFLVGPSAWATPPWVMVLAATLVQTCHAC